MCAERSLHDGSLTKAVALASLSGPQRRLITALLEAARPALSAPALGPDNKMDPAALEMPAARPVASPMSSVLRRLPS